MGQIIDFTLERAKRRGLIESSTPAILAAMAHVWDIAADFARKEGDDKAYQQYASRAFCLRMEAAKYA